MTLDDLKTMRLSVEGRVATLTLDRPDALNAANAEMHTELSKVFRLLAAEPGFDVIVFTGAGSAFCAGGDLKWMAGTAADPVRFLPLIEEGKELVFSMLECPKPIICRMNGDAVGMGATLALCCDVIVAVDTARFGDPHVRVGITAGDGAALILPQVIGMMRAKELLLTGDLLSAEEAHRLGILNHVVPAAELDARVAKLAAKLTGGAQLAIRYTKTALNSGLRRIAQEQLDMLLAYEALTINTADHREALAAMAEKRRPRFGG